MPPRTIGAPAGQAAPQRQQNAPAPTGAQQAARPNHAATPAAPASSRGGGLPPPPTNWTPPPPGSGNAGKRTDKEWESYPLRDGEHTFDAYVSKIIAWNSGGVTVTLRVTQWDRAANRSGPDHGRPLRFDQQPRKKVLDEYLANPNDQKAVDRYCNWRHDLVSAYLACGFPEDSWERDGDDIIPPWDRFFVRQHGGAVVPVVLSVTVRAWSMRDNTGRYSTPFHGLDVKSMHVVETAQKQPFQAPLPYEVPVALANQHRWGIAETKTIDKNNVPIAVVAVLDRNALTLPHAGLPTYKDL